jgi:hypothetical protein
LRIRPVVHQLCELMLPYRWKDALLYIDALAGAEVDDDDWG